MDYLFPLVKSRQVRMVIYSVFAVVGIVAMCIGAPIAWSEYQSASLHERLEAAKGQVNEIRESGRIETATQVIDKRRANYPSYYSSAWDQSLSVIYGHFVEGGVADDLLAVSESRIKEHDWSSAALELDNLGVLIKGDLAKLDELLGPVGSEGRGYYDELDRQSTEVDAGIAANVRTHISTVRVYVDQLPRKQLCGSVKKLTYSGAYDFLDQAELSIQTADQTAQTLIEGMVDKPKVYEQAVSASEEANKAKASADAASNAADQAPVQIKSAEAAIANATTYLATHAYQKLESSAALVSAISSLQQAKDACLAEDFAAVSSHATDAVSSANHAIWLATEPTPTPEPPPTPIPIPTSSSSGEWSSGTDSGSWDSGGSDSGSWDSGGSDSGSWDSGGGDSGSWDSGGSDSGSW